VHVHLDLARQGGTLTGRLYIEGEAARVFTGWIGLNAAIDELLVDKLGRETPGEGDLPPL
jgi:hypothetical protein